MLNKIQPPNKTEGMVRQKKEKGKKKEEKAFEKHMKTEKR